jgi:FkbM family methyltransferase
VISGGVGHDVSFEKELLRRFGCRIVLLDPSPTGIATMEREPMSKELGYLPVALAGQPGSIRMSPPINVAEGSWRSGPDSGSVEMPSTTLLEILHQERRNRIDLLKLDIEGFEYDVIESMLRHNVNVHQICVETHEGPAFNRSRNDRWKLIWRLKSAGYELVHCANWDHTFIRRP